MSDASILRALREDAEQLASLIEGAVREAMASVDDLPALPADPEPALSGLDEPLPGSGVGMESALARLRGLIARAGAASSGPRYFHFVTGGTTPAALGADLLATVHDTMAYTWPTSPLAVTMELRALAWLRELFGLPEDGAGVMTTGASMANFVGLAAAREWWGRRRGVDLSADGLWGLPPMPILGSGYAHASTRKVLALLGLGRESIRTCGRDGGLRLDPEALDRELALLDGEPAVVAVTLGEPNTGDSDPIEATIEVARRYDAWVHVDAAFGLFARLSPRTEHLARGVEDADSITVDGHKWLNVPYDCGMAFVRDPELLARAFRYTADYLPSPDDPRPTLGAIGPESSRRARAFAVWATLAAYGREGARAIVEHDLDLARHLAGLVDAAPDLERLAEVHLNVVAFRYRPQGVDDEETLDTLNGRLGEAILEDGRFAVGTSKHEGRTMLRPAFSNWRTRSEDVDAFVDVVRELGRAAARRDPTR